MYNWQLIELKLIFLECLFINPFNKYLETVHGDKGCNKRCKQLKLEGGECFMNLWRPTCWCVKKPSILDKQGYKLKTNEVL